MSPSALPPSQRFPAKAPKPPCTFTLTSAKTRSPSSASLRRRKNASSRSSSPSAASARKPPNASSSNSKTNSTASPQPSPPLPEARTTVLLDKPATTPSPPWSTSATPAPPRKKRSRPPSPKNPTQPTTSNFSSAPPWPPSADKPPSSLSSQPKPTQPKAPSFRPKAAHLPPQRRNPLLHQPLSPPQPRPVILSLVFAAACPCCHPVSAAKDPDAPNPASISRTFLPTFP